MNEPGSGMDDLCGLRVDWKEWQVSKVASSYLFMYDLQRGRPTALCCSQARGSPLRRPSVLSPPCPAHTLLHLIPDPLDNFSIPPPPIGALLRIPLFHPGAQHPSSPPLDTGWHLISPPPHIDTQSMLEQFRCSLPLVRFKLPRLACGEDCDDAGPVVRFELLRGVD